MIKIILIKNKCINKIYIFIIYIYIYIYIFSKYINYGICNPVVNKVYTLIFIFFLYFLSGTSSDKYTRFSKLQLKNYKIYNN